MNPRRSLSQLSLDELQYEFDFAVHEGRVDACGEIRLEMISRRPLKDVYVMRSDPEMFDEIPNVERRRQLDGTVQNVKVLIRKASNGLLERRKFERLFPRPVVRHRLLLDFFARLPCSAQTRENIRAAAGDLRKDVRDMRAKRCSRWQVLCVRFCRTTGTIVPIAWDSLARAVRAVMLVVRRIDPPRPG